MVFFLYLGFFASDVSAAVIISQTNGGTLFAASGHQSFTLTATSTTITDVHIWGRANGATPKYGYICIANTFDASTGDQGCITSPNTRTQWTANDNTNILEYTVNIADVTLSAGNYWIKYYGNDTSQVYYDTSGGNYYSGGCAMYGSSCVAADRDFRFIINGFNPSICGNGLVESGEDCDSNSRSCLTNGYAGTQVCNGTSCLWASSTCSTTLYCGDDIVSGNESCESGMYAPCNLSGVIGEQSCASCLWATTTCSQIENRSYNKVIASTQFLYGTSSVSSTTPVLKSQVITYTLPLSGYLIIILVLYYFSVVYISSRFLAV